MKIILLALATFVASYSANATKTNRLYPIDMTGDNFESQMFNLYGDGIDFDRYDAFGIKLVGVLNEDFTAVSVASENIKNCDLIPHSIKNGTMLEIKSYFDIDSGDGCEITIKYNDGRSAVLSIYEEGT